MKIYEYGKLSESEISKLSERPAVDLEKIFDIVKPILNDIKLRGLEAAISYAHKYDGFTDNAEDLRVKEEEFEEAEKKT